MSKRGRPKLQPKVAYSLFELREQFDSTGNILYAAVAIGHPDGPPTWALEACKGYAADYFDSAQDLAKLGVCISKPHLNKDVVTKILSKATKLELKGMKDSKAMEQAAEEFLQNPTQDSLRTPRRHRKLDYQVHTYPDGTEELIDRRFEAEAYSRQKRTPYQKEFEAKVRKLARQKNKDK
jgi:hypothetical protein